MSKCSVCDQRGASIYHKESMYHAMCFSEVYEPLEFTEGYDAGVSDSLEGLLYNIPLAIDNFKIDPPDSAYQWGYLQYLLEEDKNDD